MEKQRNTQIQCVCLCVQHNTYLYLHEDLSMRMWSDGSGGAAWSPGVK